MRACELLGCPNLGLGLFGNFVFFARGLAAGSSGARVYLAVAGVVAESPESVFGGGGGVVFVEILSGHFPFEFVRFHAPETQGSPVGEGHAGDETFFASIAGMKLMLEVGEELE